MIFASKEVHSNIESKRCNKLRIFKFDGKISQKHTISERIFALIAFRPANLNPLTIKNNLRFGLYICSGKQFMENMEKSILLLIQ